MRISLDPPLLESEQLQTLYMRYHHSSRNIHEILHDELSKRKDAAALSGPIARGLLALFSGA